jgi:hypothetical protein
MMVGSMIEKLYVKMVAVLLLWSATASGCSSAKPCQSFADCTNGGVCLSSPASMNMYCVGLDSSCPGQFRWASNAGDGLANKCVSGSTNTGNNNNSNNDASYVDASMAFDMGGADLLKPSTVLLFDDFSGSTIDPAKWMSTTSGGGSVQQSNGLTLSLAPMANSHFDFYSVASFPVGTEVELQVTVPGGETFTHLAIGFANGSVGPDCLTTGSGIATAAAVVRGQDTDLYVQTLADGGDGGAGQHMCTLLQAKYPGMPHDIRILRQPQQVSFYLDGSLSSVLLDALPQGPLPVHLSGYTYTLAPGSSFTVLVQQVRVSSL